MCADEREGERWERDEGKRERGREERGREESINEEDGTLNLLESGAEGTINERRQMLSLERQ